MNQETRQCQNCKQNFVIEPEDFQFYEKIQVPPPTWCPRCRMQRRMSWHNERYLFRRKSAKSGKEIFAMFPSDAAMTVWDRSEWIVDDWDQTASGKEYDWSRPFFVQFQELIARAPFPSRGMVNFVNSDYCSNSTNLKDCYLAFGCFNAESSAYLENCMRVKDCMDVSLTSDSELSYECLFNSKCYNAKYSSGCNDCQDIYFCRDCSGCSDCFGCANLKNKSHCIFNQQYSKEEYKEKAKDWNLKSYNTLEKYLKEAEVFWLSQPVRFAKNYKNNNCDGEYISNSRNVHKSYQVDGGENLKYCHGMYARPSRDSMDQYRYGNNSELIYEAAVCGGNSARIRFCYHVYDNSQEAEYSWGCIGSAYIFGCVGLHGQRYCILNRQYSESEYMEMITKIKKHMDEMSYVDRLGRIYKYGEFFPPEIAPLAYNKTVAEEYFPLTSDQAVGAGYVWRAPESNKNKPTILAKDIPDDLPLEDDSILHEIISCSHADGCSHECTEVFRIIPQELAMYRRMHVPLPRLCANCRYFQRIAQRSSVGLWHRQCMCDKPNHSHSGRCPNEFETSYAPPSAGGGPEIVYCENCYQQEVA